MIRCRCQIDKRIEQIEADLEEMEVRHMYDATVEHMEDYRDDLYNEWAFAPICSGTTMDLCLSSCTYLSK